MPAAGDRGDSTVLSVILPRRSERPHFTEFSQGYRLNLFNVVAKLECRSIAPSGTLEN